MKKPLFILLFLVISIWITNAQEETIKQTGTNVDAQIIELQNQIKEINNLYNSLKTAVNNTQTQTDQGFQTVNKKFEDFSKGIESNYSKVSSRTDKIEENLNISKTEKDKFLALSIKRNVAVQENFYQYIKFYGDKYSQLDEKVTSEELSLELRKIINPQSGTLGFKLSDQLNKVMKTNFESLIDEILVDKGKKKDAAKSKINNTLQAVTSILDNSVVNDIVGMIPYGSNIKNIVGTVSGLMVNLIDSKDIKPEFQNKLLDKIKDSQKTILKDMDEIISFYDNMAKLDNDYQITLQTIKNDVGILGLELKEFCVGLETPIKIIDPSFSIDKTKNIREITIQVSDKFELLKSDEKKVGENLNIITNMSLEIKNRTRILYDRYRAIQESKINANNEFVEQFKKVIENSKISKNSESITQQLSKKNKDLQDKMNINHEIDKKELEKWLVKISELN